MRFRPLGVTIVGLLVRIAAVWQLAVGIFCISEALNSSQDSRLFKGQYLDNVSDGYLWFAGLVAIAFGLILWRVAATLVEGDPAARIFVVALAVLNIIFALLSFPWGIAGMIVNLLVVFLLSSAGSVRWFADSQFEVKRPSAFE
ncbi:unannotated protein [freshwater metagenome]|uniref:Unannotated protein n=1 Tax=freshwater metagenome TaxID=449393 RepID=A0A6J6XPH5_9ZZZZ